VVCGQAANVEICTTGVRDLTDIKLQSLQNDGANMVFWRTIRTRLLFQRLVIHIDGLRTYHGSVYVNGCQMSD
jgi:hypothetical protein